VIEVKNDEPETDEAIVEVKAISFKGLKEGSSSSSKDRRRNLTEKEENDKEMDEGKSASDACRMTGSNLQDDYDEDEEGVWGEVSSGVGAASEGGSTTGIPSSIDALVPEIARSNLDYPGKGGSMEGGVVDGRDEG
jgi:hypothetical protein